MPGPNELSKTLLKHLTGYLEGKFPPAQDTPLTVVNPANEQVIARLPTYGATATQRAVKCAEANLATPSSLEQRKTWLLKIAHAHGTHREGLAQIITAENGKPLVEARAEVDYAASFYLEAAEQLKQLQPRTLETNESSLKWTVYSRPAGVAGLIVPWNFPLSMLAKKAAFALAAGVPIVVKPSEKTPLASIALFHIFDQLGLPPGLVNLIFGEAEAIGKVLCEHPAVRVVSFTGSTAVGKLLSQTAAPYIKRMALELGGSAPFLVFNDADLPAAVDQLMANKFRCAGQTCVCANRVYVQEQIAPEFLQLLTNRVANLRTGAGHLQDSDVGPLIDAASHRRVRLAVEQAISEGARLVLGEHSEPPISGQGFFYPPTILQSEYPGPKSLSNELFAPVVSVVHFSSEAEAVAAANNTPYGLAAYVFTRDFTRGQRLIARLSFGHIGINTAAGPIAKAPFGGMKQSGLGREGGAEGLLEFVELQTVPMAT